MKDVILSEMMKELDCKERIIMYIFKRTFMKVYKKGIEKGVNAIL